MKFRKTAFLILVIYSITTFLNGITLYFLPFIFPLSNFTVVRTIMIALFERKYILIIVALIINIIFLLTAISIKKKEKVFPIVSLLIIFVDFIFVLFLLLEGVIKERYFDWFYIPYIIIDLFIIGLITTCFNTGDGTVCD